MHNDAAPLSSVDISGLTDPLLQADLLDGPYAQDPRAEDRHVMLVPLHDGSREARFWKDGVWSPMTLAAPKVYVTGAGTTTAWSWRENTRILRLWFDHDRVQRFVAGELRILSLGSRFETEVSVDDAEICRIADLMAATLDDTRAGQAVMFNALSEMLGVHIVRCYMFAQEIAQNGGLDPQLYTQLLAHIDAEIGKTIRITDLADMAHMSESAFLRAVKATTGKTPHELVRERRMEAVKRLLRDENVSLGQVAIATGFADQAHLSRSFKQVFGDSPSAWRRRVIS